MAQAFQKVERVLKRAEAGSVVTVKGERFPVAEVSFVKRRLLCHDIGAPFLVHPKDVERVDGKFV